MNIIDWYHGPIVEKGKHLDKPDHFKSKVTKLDNIRYVSLTVMNPLIESKPYGEKIFRNISGTEAWDQAITNIPKWIPNDIKFDQIDFNVQIRKSKGLYWISFSHLQKSISEENIRHYNCQMIFNQQPSPIERICQRIKPYFKS